MAKHTKLSGAPPTPRPVDTCASYKAMRPPTNLDFDYIFKGLIGIISPVVGVLTSLQEQVEWGLRVSSLCVGLLVGTTSLISMIRKMRT